MDMGRWMDGGVFVYFFLDFCFIDEFFGLIGNQQINETIKQIELF